MVTTLRRVARSVLPDQLRSIIARHRSESSYNNFMKAAFGARFSSGAQPPVPPAEVYLKTNAKDEAAFKRKSSKALYGKNVYLTSGYGSAKILLQNAQDHGCDLSGLRSVYELGCGDGRVIRHMMNVNDLEISGSDTRQEAVDWCRKTMPKGRFFSNDFDPSLPELEDNSIDLAYAYSVFTHIPIDRQQGWLEEIRRVLRPGGLFLATVMNASLKATLSEEKRRLLDKCGRLEISADDSEAHLATKVGGSPMDVYFSVEEIEKLYGEIMPVVAYRYDGLHDEPELCVDGLGQDLVIMQKPGG